MEDFTMKQNLGVELLSRSVWSQHAIS